MKHHRASMVVALAVAALAGCSQQELYTNLRERDANEMMAVLARQNIPAAKVAGEEEGFWNLTVPSSSFAHAVDALTSVGLPREEYDDMGLVFQKSGLVSSPSEERIRFVHALSEEIAHTLSQIDGVLNARVHIVLPNNDPFGEETTPSSAAVFIKYRQDADLDASIAKIKELVIGSIEGLGPENVTVAMFPAEELLTADTPEEPQLENVMSLQLAPASVAKFWTIVGVLGALALAGIGFGVFALLRSRPRAASGAT